MTPENVRSVFLQGEELKLVLFKNAFNFAENGHNVWFISPEPIKELPKSIDPPDKEVLKLITFLYIKDCKELLKHINGIHIWYKVPELIILYGFDVYSGMNSSSYNLSQASFLCASLLDAASACGKKLARTVYLMVASNICGDNLSSEVITDMYFQQLINVDENVNFLVSPVV